MAAGEAAHQAAAATGGAASEQQRQQARATLQKKGDGSITAGDIERAISQGLNRVSKNRLMQQQSLASDLLPRVASAFTNVNEVLDARHGSVLDSRSILKVDFVPHHRGEQAGHHNSFFPVNVNGTFNLRQSSTTRIFGTAQPTIPGIRGILNLLGAGRQPASSRNGPLDPRRNVLWINLREEPTLYVNGRSTVLRDRSEPFHNIDQLQGIDPSRIHDMEKRLKEEVVEEASLYNGNVVLHEELRRRELEASWEAVTLDDIRSPEEVFFTFRMQGYRVRYVRIPTTPEKAPSAQFFDGLVDCLMETSADSVIVFNCQTGVSRSTIGMVAAGLVQMWRGIIDVPHKVHAGPSKGLANSTGSSGGSPQGKRVRASSRSSVASASTIDTAATPPAAPETTPAVKDNASTESVASEFPEAEPIIRVLSGLALSSVEDKLEMNKTPRRRDGREYSSNDAVSRQLESGWYQPTLALIRLVDSGREAKRHVDFFCEDASHLVNLRQAIFTMRTRASRERYHPSEMFKLQRAATALLRYLMLIAFDAYLATQVHNVLSTRQPSGMASPHPVHVRSASLNSSVTGGGRWARSRGSSAFPVSFWEWLHQRMEIVHLLDNVEKAPMQALEALDLHSTSTLGLEVSGEGGELRKDMREAMEARRGSMLNTDTILKADHFPGGFAERKSQEVSGVAIRGAPTFRAVHGTRVYGVCTPTVDAAAAIIRYIQAATSARRIVWTNLREEPLVYINKQPFVLRSVKQPFRNVSEFVAINPERIEAAERRLKEDILAEMKRYNGRILVHTEADDRSLELMWEEVAEDDVMTPRELYESLVDAGLPVDYARVPLTPEQAPTPTDIDYLLERVRSQKGQPGTHFVFNCQLGRGRSTTAMAIALLELQRSDESDFYESIVAFGSKPGLNGGDVDGVQAAQIQSPGGNLVMERALAPATEASAEKGGAIVSTRRRSGVMRSAVHYSSDDGTDDESGQSFAGTERASSSGHLPQLLPSTQSYAGSTASGDTSDDEAPSAAAASRATVASRNDDEFGVILSLVRVLSNGVTALKWADQTVDRCGEVEHLRKNIIEYAERAATSRTSKRAAELIERGLLNLRRFFMIVLVAAYETSYSPDKPITFARWFFRRPELKTILGEIHGREALRFASVDRVLSGPPPTEQNELGAGSPGGEASEMEGSQAEVFRFVAQRNGMVLTRGSILKSDHFPGCNRLKNAKVVIPGAPNFREIVTAENRKDDVGIYGTGIPTVEGLRGILAHVSEQRKGRKCIVWVNLREEPILYVNGRPFVLRKLEHPFENLEHTGISRERVEDMENRLKVDVLNEILANRGRLLLHDEDEKGLQPVWLTVDISEGSTSVQTPRDLYDMLGLEFNVTQFRVPITDEQAPKVTDYDVISNIVRNAPLDAEIVFNCQMGRGRTTTGLVIASAVRLWERRRLWQFAQRLPSLVETDVVLTKRRMMEAELDEASRKYLGGQYEAVGALTRVLQQGAVAKTTTDAVIDVCDALQNLREAIYGLKEVSESEDKSPVQRAAALNRGIHYLRRYYQLIEFVDYLFSSSPEDRTHINTFAAWLRGRRELKSILKRITLE